MVHSHYHFHLYEEHTSGANLLIRLELVGNTLSSASCSSLHIYSSCLLIETVICSQEAEHLSLVGHPGKENYVIVCSTVWQFVSIICLDKDLSAAVSGLVRVEKILLKKKKKGSISSCHNHFKRLSSFCPSQ